MNIKKKYPHAKKVTTSIWLCEKGLYWVDLSMRVHGVSVRRRRFVSGSEDDAILARARMKSETTAHAASTKKTNYSGSLTFIREALYVYRHHNCTNLKWAGRETYYNRLVRELGHVRIQDAWHHMMAFVEMLSESTTRRGHLYSPATINRYIEMMHAALSVCAVRSKNKLCEKLISENPLDGFPKQVEHNSFHVYIQPEQKRALYETIMPHYRPLLYRAFRAPARVTELITRKVKHLDLFSRTIILESMDEKTGSGRYMPISDEEMPYMKQAAKRGINAPLFAGHDGGPIKAVSLQHHFKKCVERVGIDSRYTFHCTRGQAAFELMVEKEPKEMVMHLGGWKTDAAFRRYVDIGQVQSWQIRKILEQDTSWKKDLAPVPQIAA